ncbi:cupin domain-containing protein [Streptomyces triculaminicus]|uniref:cupin domain-containing protein n=1 Tax=Streptomyces triculaminicus TaxID=2816232 RepID=UPI0037D6B04B
MEHLLLASGRALAGVSGEEVELGPGDYIVYPADLPHVFEALSPSTRAVLVLEHP